MDDVVNEISDDEAMRILNDISWNDNNESNNDGDNGSSNNGKDDINDKQNITSNDFVEDDIIAILDSIRNEKANDNIDTGVDGNKKILIKDKNVEFQIDHETLMKWNADCASCNDDDENDITDTKNDSNVVTKNDKSTRPNDDNINKINNNNNDNVYDNNNK